MYLFEGIFDDPMCFWPFVPGATLEERCVAAKRFGVYVMIVGGAVMWSVRAVIFGFAIAVLSHIAFCVDSCIMERKERGKRFETGDKTNPYANYTVGRDVTEVYGSAPSAKMRTTFQSVVEDPHSTDVTRFLSVPRQDLMQRIRISGFRSDMVTFFTAAEFMKKLVKGGDYSAFDKEIKSSESAALKGSLPDPKSMWRRNKAGDLEIVPPLVRSPEMVHTFWQFLPTKNDRMVKSGVTNRKTIQNLISNDSTLATLEKQIEFLVRLAAHDFVLLEFIRKHNYHLDRNTFGDDIATAQEDVFLPPGVKTKIETPMLRLGSEAIPTIPKACRTVEETNANMLVLPDKHGTRDDDQDIKTRSYMMVEKLVELFKDSTYREILHALFPRGGKSKKYEELDRWLSSDADDSYMLDREYVARKDRGIDPTNSLARAIYDALNIMWKVGGSRMHVLDVGAHIWFIVKHCKGDPKWMDGNIEEMRLKKGETFPEDPEFKGVVLDKSAWDSSPVRTEILPIQMSRSQLGDKNAGAPPMKITKSVFRWFLESLPDGFVHKKTLVMDGASVHGKATDDQKQKNELLDKKAVFPEGELSEFATLLRARGAGDGVVERNVVPVMLPKPEDQIETVANPTDANVVVPPRRSCMGMFVDGKYPDPSKHRTRPVGTDKPDEYRDYTRAKPFDDEYPGKEFRKDMDVKVPVTKTCEKSLQDETPGSKRAIEIEQHTEPVRGEKDEILACRQRSARTYEKREKVMFLPFQSTQWRVGIVAEAPSDQSSKHNPWVKIFYEENGKHVTKPITINRIRPFSSTAAATQKRVQEAREESEAKRLEFVQRRREARNQQADNMSDFRQRAMAFENDPGEKERRKRMVAALVAKNGKQDPQDAYMDKKAKSISNDTLVTLPNVFSAMLTVR
eukprot:jgi/Mesvir1/5610/Mv15628-RA.1